MISAHIDTLGAVVRNVKANGRLELTNTGGYAWGSVEGENVLIHTLSGKLMRELCCLSKLLSIPMEMWQENYRELKKYGSSYR